MHSLHFELLRVACTVEKVISYLHSAHAPPDPHAQHGLHRHTNAWRWRDSHAEELERLFYSVRVFLSHLGDADAETSLTACQRRLVHEQLADLSEVAENVLARLQRDAARRESRRVRVAAALRLGDGLAALDESACKCSAIVDQITAVVVEKPVQTV